MSKPIQAMAIIPFATLTIFGFASNNQTPVTPLPAQDVIAYQVMPLGDRYPNKFVNDVFKDNILLDMAYLSGKVTSTKDIKWDEITKPFKYEFTLEPNETFAFHEDIEDKYKDSLVKTTNAHFNFAEGFKTDGYLFGDGVCHLASLINWVARDAGLTVEAPTNHNFAHIPDIPRQYGVSIYDAPGAKGSSELQNLYITNNKSKPVAFSFDYEDDQLKLSAIELN